MDFRIWIWIWIQDLIPKSRIETDPENIYCNTYYAYYSNITLPINESIQQANFKACCGKRLCLFWWWLFSVVQLLFLVINLTDDGKLGVEFAILSVAFWSLLICGNLLCNWWKKFRQILEVSLSTKCQVYLITINCSGVSIFGGISTTGESISQCPKKIVFTQFLFNSNSIFLFKTYCDSHGFGLDHP